MESAITFLGICVLLHGVLKFVSSMLWLKNKKENNEY